MNCVRALLFISMLTMSACCGGLMTHRKSNQDHYLRPLLASLGDSPCIGRSTLVSACGLAGLKSTVQPPGYKDPRTRHVYNSVSETWCLAHGYTLVGLHVFPKPTQSQIKDLDSWLSEVPMTPPSSFSEVFLLDRRGKVVISTWLPIEKRMNFLRKRLPGGGSCL